MTEPQGTPLTDARAVQTSLGVVFRDEQNRRCTAFEVVDATFARDLERKLAGLREGSLNKDAEIKDLRDALSEARGETYPWPKNGWRCFHCGEWFKNYRSACSHFGRTPHAMKERAETAERQLAEMTDMCEDANARWVHRLRLHAETERQLAEREARIAALTNMVKWSIKHEGECLGDFPHLLDAAKAMLEASKEGGE